MVVDSQRMQQILKNLLANAVKFTEHGKVSLHVRAGGNGRIRFEVCDTGIGIAREQLDVIFEAFRQADGSTRRRYGGTGLGLSISRDLAERMGGGIQVDSEPGRGSCFILSCRCRERPRRRSRRCRCPRGSAADGAGRAAGRARTRCDRSSAGYCDGRRSRRPRSPPARRAPDPGGRGRCHVRRSTGGAGP